jgi:hypothetical protein
VKIGKRIAKLAKIVDKQRTLLNLAAEDADQEDWDALSFNLQDLEVKAMALQVEVRRAMMSPQVRHPQVYAAKVRRK